jgi:putative isomerase
VETVEVNLPKHVATRRQFLRSAMLGSLACLGGRLRAEANTPAIASADGSRALAARWLAQQRGRVSARDFELLRRAQGVLYQNILTTGDEGKPLPWAPLRGICPSLAKYPGVWDWDGSFHALAISRWDGELAREQLRIILDRQQPSGLLINNIRANGQIRTRYGGPPLTPWVCARILESAPDQAFLQRAYPQYVRYEQHLWRNRGGQADGLFHYATERTGVAKDDRQAIRFESGWDNSVRWDDTVDLWTPDMNSFVVLVYRGLERMAKWLSLSADTARWRVRGQALGRQINERLFDSKTGAYLDRRRDTGQFSQVLTAASLQPLFAGVADAEKAAAMAKLAADPRKLLPGMPTLAYDHPKYDSAGYWRGPTWPETTYFATKGLKHYGYTKTAEAIRQTFLDWCASNKDSLYEYYDSKSGKGLGEPQYAGTAAFVIELILSWDAPGAFENG